MPVVTAIAAWNLRYEIENGKLKIENGKWEIVSSVIPCWVGTPVRWNLRYEIENGKLKMKNRLQRHSMPVVTGSAAWNLHGGDVSVPSASAVRDKGISFAVDHPNSRYN
jgi:hypothetical protein